MGNKIKKLVLLLAPPLLAWPGDACESELLARRQILAHNFTIQRGHVALAGFDAVGTLLISRSGQPWPVGAHDVLLLPGAVEKVQALNRAGYLVVIFSNQPGIPDYVSKRNADAALLQGIELLKKEGAVVHYFDFAGEAVHQRKPGRGMFELLLAILKAEVGPVQITRGRSFIVGDSQADRGLAKELKVRFFRADRYFDREAP